MAKSFNKQMIAESYKQRFGGTTREANEVVYWFQELIQQEIYRGVPVHFPMIGKFTPKFRKARPARNPKTGAVAVCAEQHSVKFKPSAQMIIWLNKNRNKQSPEGSTF